MTDLLKNIYNKAFLHQFGEKVHSVYPAFDIECFIATIMDNSWQGLALKARMRRITLVLGQNLPSRYEEAINILFAVNGKCSGFPYLFFPDFVAVYGQADEYWELSIEALERFTVQSSAEFAVRPFLLRDPERMMRQMEEWTQHPNEHVRRLASEGCRPRLPWGESLPMFKLDPAPVLRVLELLKADASIYVRKSVANNLNDISKDNPSVVIETARRWKGVNAYTDWIVRRGCRSLIRHANPEIMALFGYAEPLGPESLITCASLSCEPSVLSIGDNCELKYMIGISEGEPVRIRVEYGIDFIKANGRPSRKSFLLSDKTAAGGIQLTGTRIHFFTDLTTRRHYPGEHWIGLLVNGHEVAHASIKLEANSNMN